MADFVAGLLAGWILRDLMERRLRQFARRRGSNPPPLGRKPAPPVGPPEQPIRFDESPTQRGNGNGGPTTPNPPIKPQPTGGRLIKSWEEPSPPPEP